MTHQNVQEMLDAIKKAEIEEFMNVADRLFVGPVNKINLEGERIYCDVMQFYLDDEIARGMVICISKSTVRDPIYVNAEGHEEYLIRFQDGNWQTFNESSTQVCLGDLSRITDALRELESATEVGKKMLGNYMSLNETERLFLSEIVGDEDWLKANVYLLPSVFSGEKAPNGDSWDDACFAKTQRLILDKIRKGID